MDSEFPPMLNLLATELKTVVDHKSLDFMSAVIREATEADQEKFSACLRKMPYPQFLKTFYWQAVRKNMLATHPMCHWCGFNHSSEIHHMHHRYAGDDHMHPEVLFALCFGCSAAFLRLGESARNAVRAKSESSTDPLRHVSQILPDDFLKGGGGK